MQGLNSTNLLSFLMAGTLIWVSAKILIAVIRLNRSYLLEDNRLIYPANCKPDRCLDPAGFIGFITPRLVLYAVLCLLISALLLVCQFTELLGELPYWLSSFLPLLLFLPLFAWYVIFINKAAKRFW